MKAQGQKELNKYIDGKRLTPRQMILAKCFECMGNYEDGREDCQLNDCPLYPMMPYGVAYRTRKRESMPLSLAKALYRKQKEVSTP